MGLSEYRRKRDLENSPEPSGSAGAGIEPDAFVVQKHAATSTHYDLRLRVGNVLKSWAVPKGPSLDPREKRLAVEVEDHPLKYADFEGVIPEGHYGAGPVMIWDRGRWSPEGDAPELLESGVMKFRLEGERLKGRWALIRTKGDGRQKHWLLLKERDSDAAAGVHAETFATSVASGRTMDEIAAGAPARERPKAEGQPLSAAALAGARRAAMPARLRPQLATPSVAPPDGDGWLHEAKFDGYRLLAFRSGESVRLVSRTGLDWTAKLSDVAKAIGERLRVDAVLDGEAVILDSRGVSDFQALQNAIHSRRSRAIVYFAFDLPWCDGFDLTRAPLEQRRDLLAQILGRRQGGRVRFSESVTGNGPAVFAQAAAGGLEGIVSKKRGSPYVQSRTGAWLKTKCFNQQEFVIGGFSAPEGSREELGALLLGYHEGKGLRFAGKVGTGFSTETLKKLAAALRPLVRATPPFADPPTGAEARGVTWVRPELVCQVQFRDWTADGVVRHTSFRGLREDLDPGSVTREPSSAGAAPPVPPANPPATRHRSRLTNPERVVFPDRGAGYAVTKTQLAEYYEAVAPRMLPHVAGRPLAILRCPDGEGGKSFFQKHPAKGMPEAVSAVEIAGDDGVAESHLMIRDAAGLLGLVQMNALEFHPWGSRAESPESPDRLIFDLDPGEGVTWSRTVEAAVMVREALAQTGLRGFARVSGGKGIHVIVPLKPGHTWAQARSFSKAAAEALVKIAPRQFVAVAGAANRDGRIFIDYLRNARGATAVASYSTRARPGAPVALPVAWDELAGLESARAFNVVSVLRRLAGPGTPPDPWAGIDSAAGKLPV